MSTTAQELAKRFLRREWETLAPHERRVIEHVLNRAAISRNVFAPTDEPRTFGQRVADKMASFGGSWAFIISFLIFLCFWAAVNTIILRQKAFDPYPFIFLNLFLSMIAALQAPVIMMSQNRQAERDRARAEHDYEVNLKAEMEIRALHDKMDDLKEKAWANLVAQQEEEIEYLRQLVGNLEKK